MNILFYFYLSLPGIVISSRCHQVQWNSLWEKCVCVCVFVCGCKREWMCALSSCHTIHQWQLLLRVDHCGLRLRSLSIVGTWCMCCRLAVNETAARAAGFPSTAAPSPLSAVLLLSPPVFPLICLFSLFFINKGLLGLSRNCCLYANSQETTKINYCFFHISLCFNIQCWLTNAKKRIVFKHAICAFFIY